MDFSWYLESLRIYKSHSPFKFSLFLDYIMFVSRMCSNLVESILPSAHKMFPVLQHNPKAWSIYPHAQQLDKCFLHQFWCPLFFKHTFVDFSLQPVFHRLTGLFSKMLFEMFSRQILILNFVRGHICTGVTEQLSSVHNSRVCQIFLEVFCSQTWVLTCDAISSTLSFRPYLDLTFNSFLYYQSRKRVPENTFLSCYQRYATA